MNTYSELEYWNAEMKPGEAAWLSGLTNQANRHRLRRGAERSRDSENMRENGRQYRRGPS